MAEERDIKAAHVLMELANCVLCLPEIKLLTTALTNGTRKDANSLSNNCKSRKIKAVIGGKLNFPLSNAYAERKQKKRKAENVFALPKSKIHWTRPIIEEEEYLDGWNEYKYLHSRSKKFTDEPTSLMKNSGLQNVGAEISDDASIKPEKSPMITPTLHTGFSFSIIHLLSAVRIALLTPPAEGLTSANGIQEDKNPQGINASPSCQSKGVENLKQAEEKNLPKLNIDQIVSRVRLRPGDPCILETKEPLIDLVRGVLKILSCKTAPLRAKGWKPLTAYAKSNKRWSWIGPVSLNFSINDCASVDTASEAWCIPHKIIVKMVDCFANWLKNDQEALKRVGCLPSPPLVLLMQPANAEDRFQALKPHKSLITISPSSGQVKTYFHEEEIVRHLFPKRAFSYTALDGRKSMVAPLRMCSGKPSGKARDHFMLKRSRPPHVTVLGLVRDAAARLPGKMGTRADVCTLLRDSQYVVDDISNIQVNQVVSGALDRLHCEVDPCVKFDRDRHLWVYLHGDREEEDFVSDGCCSSRRNCKSQGETGDGEGSG
ncbi:uncharacterized protein LOC131326252 [Rhododendron vialii]|uniref:uncharacterized protein LOC131326252 n=1 Tax=Rhododendron vialii TaxID=182163 RepID=UPI00265E4C9F|nr:uncharacterized protein LOC131326252 [Rhododendron vialii]